MSSTQGGIRESRQDDQAYADFLARYPAYAKTAPLDHLRATQYRRLDDQRQIYLDYTGACLYAESQLAEHLEMLRSGVFGNPHSANPTSAAMTEHVERTRRLRADIFQRARRRLHSRLYAKRLGGP